MTEPLEEWPASTPGPSIWSMTAEGWAAAAATPRRGVAAAMTVCPSSWSRSNTGRQLEASPNAPWTRRIVGLGILFLSGWGGTVLCHRRFDDGDVLLGRSAADSDAGDHLAVAGER